MMAIDTDDPSDDLKIHSLAPARDTDGWIRMNIMEDTQLVSDSIMGPFLLQLSGTDGRSSCCDTQLALGARDVESKRKESGNTGSHLVEHDQEGEVPLQRSIPIHRVPCKFQSKQ
jgi:hypothetical protein